MKRWRFAGKDKRGIKGWTRKPREVEAVEAAIFFFEHTKAILDFGLEWKSCSHKAKTLKQHGNHSCPADGCGHRSKIYRIRFRRRVGMHVLFDPPWREREQEQSETNVPPTGLGHEHV